MSHYQGQAGGYPPPPQQQGYQLQQGYQGHEQQGYQGQGQQMGYPPPPPQGQQQMGFAPSPNQQTIGGASLPQDERGNFDGGSYVVNHRDTNTILSIQLAQGCPVIARPGVMIAMSSSVTLKGAVKFSMKKLVTGGEMTTSTYTGPGELQLAPTALGDIHAITLHGQEQWNIGKDAFLASTQGIIKENKSQGFGKAMFSGEGLFIYKISGAGVIWVTSFGGIIRRELQPNEHFTVDNDHLVAWNTKYNIEKVASGGILSNISSGEGLVCRFVGPGTVMYQTRNAAAFAQWVGSYLPSN